MVPFDFALYCVCNNAFNLGVNQRLKLSTCQRPKLSSLATFSGNALLVKRMAPANFDNNINVIHSRYPPG